MPFYEYQCKKCGHHLEAMQKVNDAPLKKCPECGKSALQRLMSAPVFRLKGAGWYETDFKSDQEGKRNLADKPEAEPAKDDKKDGKDAKDTKESKEPAAKEAPAAKDEPTAAGKAAESADKASAKAAEAKPATPKSSSTTRNVKRAGAGASAKPKPKSKKPGKRPARR
jgi:putative FmdB family regulatory protein